MKFSVCTLYCLLQARSRFVVSLWVVSVVSPTVQTARNTRTFTRVTSLTTAATQAATRLTHTRRHYASTSNRTVASSRQSSHIQRHRRHCARPSSPTSPWTRPARHPTTTTREALPSRSTTPTRPAPTNRANSGAPSTCSLSHRKRKWLVSCWHGIGIRWRCRRRRRRLRSGGCLSTTTTATGRFWTEWRQQSSMTIGSDRLQWTFAVIVTRPLCSSWSRRRPVDSVNGTSTVTITEAGKLAVWRATGSLCVLCPDSSLSSPRSTDTALRLWHNVFESSVTHANVKQNYNLKSSSRSELCTTSATLDQSCVTVLDALATGQTLARTTSSLLNAQRMTLRRLLICRGNCSATSNNMKLVHWPFMGGLLSRGTGRGRSPLRPLLDVPIVTVHPSTASVPVTVYCCIMVGCSAVLMCP